MVASIPRPPKAENTKGLKRQTLRYDISVMSIFMFLYNSYLQNKDPNWVYMQVFQDELPNVTLHVYPTNLSLACIPVLASSL